MGDANGQPSETATNPIGSGETNRVTDSAAKRYKSYIKAAFSTSGIIGLIQDKKVTLKNSILALVTFGLERLVNSQIFDCPLKDYQVYGNCFLYAPMLLLFCANVLIIGEVWQLSGRCFIRRYRRRGDVIARLIPSGIIKAMVGPAAWLIAAFANGKYYVCATVGPGIAKIQNMTGNLTEAEENVLKEKIDAGTADSHIFAWVVFGIITVLGAVTIITRNCFLKDDMLLKNLYMFERREAAGAMFAFQEVMRGDKVHVPTTVEVKEIKLNFGDDDEFEFFPDGIPEAIGRKNVEKMFKDAKDDYVLAYEEFRKMYPRATNGNPHSPWRKLSKEEARAIAAMDAEAGSHESVEMEALVPAAHE